MDTGVRRFTPADRQAVEEICYQTGFMGEPADGFWRHKPSFVEVFCGYYLRQEPQSLYVAVQAGAVVGYLTGCLNSARVPPPDAVITAQVLKHALLFRPGTAGFFWRALLDSLRDRRGVPGEFLDVRWPAHLHINLLPEARAAGLGRALIECWLAHLRESGSPGCYLSTIAENTRAVGFFERMGFRKHGPPTRIPGMRGRSGERLHRQIMVQSL